MTLKIKQIIFIICLLYIEQQVIFPQQISRDNYTGNWETVLTWDSLWAAPRHDSINFNVTVNGYITSNSSISFANSLTVLTINDTLIINGNLVLGNKNKLVINDNGILIVKGNLTIDNKTFIEANGYLIITYNVIKVGSINQGSFTSNDDTIKVFIAGTTPIPNHINYPVLNTVSPPAYKYPGSNYSFGNITDLTNDPLYIFFKTTCTNPWISANTPLCAGQSLNLRSSGGSAYMWTGPKGFSGSVQNPSIPNADPSMDGTYKVSITAAPGCFNSAIRTVTVVVNELPRAVASSNGPVCAGDELNLNSSGGVKYSWTGPGGFKSAGANLLIPNAKSSMTGLYIVNVTDVNNCTAPASANVVVNALPVVDITGLPDHICPDDHLALTGSPAGGIFSFTSGPGNISGNILTATGAGTINFNYVFKNVCTNKAVRTIEVFEKPQVLTGPDQLLEFTFETKMKAELQAPASGIWSVISGPAQIQNENDPESIVKSLALGENVFLWTVNNHGCEDSAKIKITVHDLFIPSVITPNGDGKNDYFIISATNNGAELIIFNKWGNVEYRNTNYLNDWNGRNNKGEEMSEETYFYIIDLHDGVRRKGTILIVR